MRSILLWAAQNRWLQRHLPDLPFMRRAVRRFLPGETLGSALEAAAALQATGIASIVTHLGEGPSTAADADATMAEYLRILDAIEQQGLRAEISVKPTQLGVDHDEERAFGRLLALADRAGATGSFLWIDMESSAYTERTISLYERLHEPHPRTGLCLQAYLRRTPSDIERLLPMTPAIRLVKGAYDEPKAIAHRDKRVVDESFVALATRIVDAARDRPVRLGLGTHDVELIDRVLAHATEAGVDPAAVEVEMLYGIRTREQHRLAGLGIPVVTLISYGEHWYPWYMRRLAERPANLTFALRSLLP
jgi:proline dehydrogenase